MITLDISLPGVNVLFLTVSGLVFFELNKLFKKKKWASERQGANPVARLLMFLSLLGFSNCEKFLGNAFVYGQRYSLKN